MTKLANLRATRLDGKLPNRLTRDGNRDDVRLAEQPWRAWYGTQRWRKLAAKVKLRDRYTCQRTGIALASKPPKPDSPVVHHKTPHRGDPAKFWDEENLETVSKQWHDSEAQAQEARGREPAGVWY